MPQTVAVRASTEPVLAVLVCHDGQQWLRAVLSALRGCSPRPRHVLAVDTGSTDGTAALLAEAAAARLVDGVLTLDRHTGFGTAVRAAVDAGVTRWGDPGRWIWLLHDDSAPEPDCLGVLLRTAELSPSAGLLGPLALDWTDPRLVVEVGLSTDASGHRQTGVGPTELDWSRFGDSAADQESFVSSTFEQSTEVLAVSSAGALIRRDVWAEVDGYDPALSLLRDDVDFGWRVNRSGHVALCVPSARLRHARAVSRGLRPPDALAGASVRAADRAHGVRTVLVNCTTIGFIVGLPRIVLLCLLRMIGFTLLRRLSDARAELGAIGYLLGGRAGLRAARVRRAATATAGGRQVRGLLTSRTTRLRNVFRGGLASWVRRRAAADAALGRLPADRGRAALLTSADAEPSSPGPGRTRSVWLAPRTTAPGAAALGEAAPGEAGSGGAAELGDAALGEPGPGGTARGRAVGDTGLGDAASAGAGLGGVDRAAWSPARGGAPVPVGPAALPAGALGRRGASRSRVAGLRRPAIAVAVSLAVDAEPLPTGRLPSPRPRPSPVPRDGSGRPDLMLVEVGRGRIAAQLLLAPPVLLVVGLAIVCLVTNAGRLGTHLAGGALLPAQGLAATWSDYLASWHAVAGGTAAPAPATLAVLGTLGTVLYPLGGPPTALAVLLLGDAPLAGVLAYAATRTLPVRRWVRALVAAGYALLPPATAAVAQGRLDVVVVHVLLPPVLAGVVALLTPSARRWLSSAAGTALGLAVIGAFAPLVHSLVVVVALVGFVVVPGRLGDGRRRAAALFAVVLLPLALLVPWPAVVLTDPSVLLSGVSGNAQPIGTDRWLDLVPLLAVVVAIVLRPRRAVLPGLALAVLGVVAVGLVATTTGTPLDSAAPQRFWTGAPMVLAGAGLAWALLAACRTDGSGARRQAVRLLAGLGAAAVLALAVASVFTGGPLRNGSPTLAPALAGELSDTGRSTLVLATNGQPVRQAGGRLPAFGDDDVARVPGASQRLARWDADLISGDPTRTKAAIAQAATSGVLFVVLPDRVTADRFTTAAGDLASRVSATSDGRPVARLQPASGSATLISPALARQAVTGGQPPTVLGAQGISPVPVGPPEVAVRVSEGALGRLLVLAADDEDGWQATVDGQPAPTVRAWGHLVAVTVPSAAADVRVEVPETLRDALLLVQAAVLLFTVLTAIPSRRK